MQIGRLFLTIAVLLSFLPLSFAQERIIHKHSRRVRVLAFSPVDALLIATVSEETSNAVKLWDLPVNIVENLRGYTSTIISLP